MVIAARVLRAHLIGLAGQASLQSKNGQIGYRPSFEIGSFRCKPRHYRLPNQDGMHVVYTYIRKNACSAFKALMMERSKVTRKHGFVYAQAQGLETLHAYRPRWWHGHCDMRMFVYRDPFERCVSAFVNKFVEARNNNDIFANFAAETGKSPKTATFADFVAYIDGPFEALDCHVWPQKSHLADEVYTHAIPMQKLSQVVGSTLPSLAPYFSQPANASKWKTRDPVSEVRYVDLSTTPADQIRALGVYSKDNFRALKPEVDEKYAMDLDMITDVETTAVKRGAQPR